MGEFRCLESCHPGNVAVLGGGYCEECGCDTAFKYYPDETDLLVISPDLKNYSSRLGDQHVFSLDRCHGGSDMEFLLEFSEGNVDRRARQLAFLVNESGFKRAVMDVPQGIAAKLENALKQHGIQPVYR